METAQLTPKCTDICFSNVTEKWPENGLHSLYTILTVYTTFLQLKSTRTHTLLQQNMDNYLPSTVVSYEFLEIFQQKFPIFLEISGKVSKDFFYQYRNSNPNKCALAYIFICSFLKVFPSTCSSEQPILLHLRNQSVAGVETSQHCYTVKILVLT